MVLVEAIGNGSAQKLEHLIDKELIFGLLISELLRRCCKLWIKPRCCSDGLHRRRQKDCGFSARAMLLRYCMKTPFKFLITDVSFLALRHGVMVFAALSVHSNRRLLCPIIVPMFICFWAPGLKEGGAAVGTQIGLESLTSVCWDRVCRCLWGYSDSVFCAKMLSLLLKGVVTLTPLSSRSLCVCGTCQSVRLGGKHIETNAAIHATKCHDAMCWHTSSLCEPYPFQGHVARLPSIYGYHLSCHLFFVSVTRNCRMS